MYLLQRKRSKTRKLDESQIMIRFKDIGELAQSLLDDFYVHEFLRFPFNQVRTKDTKKILDETVSPSFLLIISSLIMLDLIGFNLKIISSLKGRFRQCIRVFIPYVDLYIIF
jgi:hypothetical protein